MECKFNSPLSDEQIHLYLEGDASQEVEQHVEECEFCAQRVEEATEGDIMPALAVLLHRAYCPSSDKLRNYHFDVLNPNDKAEVDQHLGLCHFCREELAEMREFLETEIPFEDPAPVDSPTVDITAPNFMFAQPSSGERVALRGTIPESVKFKAETSNIFLELETSAEGYELSGQVTDEEDINRWSEATIELWKDGYILDTVQADDIGEFAFLLTEVGMIDIRAVAKDGTSIIISDIEYKD